jgi:hypothetical protein
MKDNIEEGAMLSDLIRLFEQRDKVIEQFDGKDRVNWLKAIDRSIVMRHAYAWYDGEEDVETERWQMFYSKVKSLIKQCHDNEWHKYPSLLSEMWVEGVLAIDECHDDEPFLNKLDQKDIARHWLNGGSQFGLARNIQKQIKAIVEKEQKQVMDRAEKRFSDHSDV